MELQSKTWRRTAIIELPIHVPYQRTCPWPACIGTAGTIHSWPKPCVGIVQTIFMVGYRDTAFGFFGARLAFATIADVKKTGTNRSEIRYPITLTNFPTLVCQANAMFDELHHGLFALGFKLLYPHSFSAIALVVLAAMIFKSTRW